MHWLPYGFCMMMFVIVGMSHVHAEVPRVYNLEGFEGLLEGNPESTAIADNGSIILPPAVQEIFQDASAMFSAVAVWHNDMIVARVDTGDVQLIDSKGHARVLLKPKEDMITSLLVADDALYVATATPAVIYRLQHSNDVPQVFATLQANYIWDMTGIPQAGIAVVTGEPASVIRITNQVAEHTWAAPDQTHLRSIAYHPTLGLFAGGGQRGVLYRQALGGHNFRALFDSGHAEITSLLVRDNNAYIACVTTNTDKNKSTDVRSQLIRVDMQGASESLAGSNDEIIFSMAFDSSAALVLATGGVAGNSGRAEKPEKPNLRGRLYRVDPVARSIALLYQSASRRLSHVVAKENKHLIVAAALGGRIIDVSTNLAPKGTFLSAPFDAGMNAHFGRLQMFGRYPEGTSATLAVRSGQTAVPDSSWSDWFQEKNGIYDTVAKVDNGRYAQLRIQLSTKNLNTSPSVQRVRLSYMRQNMPPFVHDVVPLPKGLALLSVPREENKSKIISLLEKTDANMADDKKNNAAYRQKMLQARQVVQPGALSIKWQADDINGDDLLFDIYVRDAAATPQEPWFLLKRDIDTLFYTFETEQLPDGNYTFRVCATDAPSNALNQEQHHCRDSHMVAIVNTAPHIRIDKPRITRQHVEIKAIVEDKKSALLSITYALDAAPAKPVLPNDGVVDGPTEYVLLTFENLQPGKHMFTLQAMDEAGNIGYGQVVFNIEPL